MKQQTGKQVSHIGDGQIAVVGVACRFPGAQNPPELWENILARRQQFRRMRDERLPLSLYQSDDRTAPDKTYGTQAALIDGYEFDYKHHRIPKSTAEATDLAQWLALDTALAVLDDAGYTAKALPKTGTRVIVGNTLTGEFSRANMMRLRWPFVRQALARSGRRLGMSAEDIGLLAGTMEGVFKSNFPGINEDSLAGGLANTIAGRICNYLDVNGGGYTVDGACSSSLLAIYYAASDLAARRADFVLAGGVDISLDPFELVGFAKAGALTTRDMTVYDKRGSGFIPGEGCGFVALKRLSDARCDGDRIYAVLDGWGLSSDGKGGLTAPSVNGQTLALQQAYAMAGVDPREVLFVEGHGTATKVGDPIELRAISAAMTSHGGPQRRACGVTSFKSIVGHTKAAAGIGALIKAVMAVNQRVLPPTAGCDTPHPVFAEDASCLFPIRRGSVFPADAKLRAGVSSMGFGGINVHVTVRSEAAPEPTLQPAVGTRAAMASPQDSEVFCLSAASHAELKEKLLSLRNDVDGCSLAELTDAAADYNARNVATKSVRAAIIAGSPSELDRAVSRCIERLDGRPADSEIQIDANSRVILSEGPRKRLGWLLPGQGSQRPAMARVLLERFQWARDFTAQAADWARAAGLEGLDRYLDLATDTVVTEDERSTQSAMLRDTRIAQPFIVLGSLLWAQFLRRLGLQPSVVLGHSLGELSAFHLAGLLDEKSLIETAVLRGQLMAGAEAGATAAAAGAMLSLPCDRARAEDLLNQTPHEGTLVIANLNSPLQTVVSGTTSAIEALSAVCASAGLSATQLPVSNAFHSPLVADAGEALSRSARVPMAAAPTACTLISSIDGGVIAGSIDVRRHFGRQIVQSVDFVRATATLAAHCDVAVEVGPGAVLTRLIEQAEPALPLTVCALEEKVESARGLNRVIALAHAHGHRINWSELYTGRVVRPFTPASAKKFIVNPCERAMAVPEPGGTLTSAALAGIGVEGLVGNDTDASPAPAFLADVTEPANEVPVGGELGSALGSLMELAVDLTGFDRETIAPEWSLTDDLNLDSIKVASLVARIEQEYAIQGRIDPATAAQITLGQLAEMVDDLRAAEPAGTDETASPRAGSRWVRSFEMRLVADPQPAVSDVSAFRNRVVGLLCDEKDDAVADAVAGELKALDAEVMRIPTDEDGITSADCEVLIAVLPRRERSPGDDETAVRGQVKRLCRVTAMLKRSPSCRSVLFVQFGGLSTGQDLLAGSLGSAACSSFAASLHHDRPELSVRVLDFAPQVDADDIARITLREHNGKVGYQLHHYDESLTRHSQESRVIEARLAPERDIDWTSDDVILVTGGAKGITAECAFALARATGARMALVGSSPYASGSERTSEIGRTLARYAQAGLAADYFACDVTDPRAVAALVETVKGQLGPVSGIIHGAGVNKPRRAEDVDEHAALAEVSPKLLGIFNLCRALADAPPKLIVGLSSIIGITGMPGNAWYAFSNEALNLFLQRFASAHPGCQVVAAAYSIWDEVGMGARMGSVEHLAHQGISAVPVREGVESFLNLVLRKPSAHQVVIAGRLEGLDTWPKPIPAAPAAQRFLEEVIAFEPGVEVVSRVRLSLTEDLYLRDHFFRGMYLFPTVFGLEAMAESVARVLGRERLDPLVIENISLTRPIVVDETRGAEIEVRALVQERTASEQPERVRVEIACAETGFLASHFAADFVLESPRATVSPAVTPRRPEAALPLEPQSELYGSLLWQGPLFQRLERVWRLDSLGSMSEVAVNRKGRFFASHPSTDLVLGDPAYRDVLLQSAQLSLRGHWLPIGIQAMQIHRIERSSSSTACVQTDFVQENDSHCDVVVTEGFGGPIIETLVSYELKQISEEPQAPTPEDWADPGERDRRIVDELMRRAGEELGAMETACELHFTPNLPPVSDTGGAAAMLPRLQSVAARLHHKQSVHTEAPTVVWTDGEGPAIHGEQAQDWAVSWAQDDRHTLCTAARGARGCAIEATRPPERVPAGHREAAITDELIRGGDAPDAAGARLRAALDAAGQYLGGTPREISLSRRAGPAVLFSASVRDRHVDVLTLHAELTRPPAKILAWSMPNRAVTVEDPAEAAQRHTAAMIHPDAGPHGQLQVAHRHRVTFKDASTDRQAVGYDTYADWMGELRELATVSVAGNLVADLMSGRWGMVTNHSEIQILDEVRCLDTLDSRMYLSRAYGTHGSSVDMHFAWTKTDASGARREVARGSMATTWVEIVGHGAVEVRPFPDYMQALIDGYLPEAARPHVAAPAADSVTPLALARGAFEGHAPGRLLYRAPHGPRVEPEIGRRVFETTLVNSNLVGNIYYANYYHWQRQAIDLALREWAAGEIRGGEPFCLRSTVRHLREAMPFDRIEVTVCLRALYQRALSLHFDYFKIGDDGRRAKLAVGEYDALWVKQHGERTPVDVPAFCYAMLGRHAPGLPSPPQAAAGDI